MTSDLGAFSAHIRSQPGTDAYLRLVAHSADADSVIWAIQGCGEALHKVWSSGDDPDMQRVDEPER